MLQDVFKAEGMCHSHSALNTQQQGRGLKMTNKDKPQAWQIEMDNVASLSKKIWLFKENKQFHPAFPNVENGNKCTPLQKKVFSFPTFSSKGQSIQKPHLFPSVY